MARFAVQLFVFLPLQTFAIAKHGVAHGAAKALLVKLKAKRSNELAAENLVACTAYLTTLPSLARGTRGFSIHAFNARLTFAKLLAAVHAGEALRVEALAHRADELTLNRFVAHATDLGPARCLARRAEQGTVFPHCDTNSSRREVHVAVDTDAARCMERLCADRHRSNRRWDLHSACSTDRDSTS